MEPNQPNKPQQKNINIKAKDEVIEGRYANMAHIQHTKEEFVIDFMSVFHPQGALNARVIVSPGHFKRMISAMQDNLNKYEQRFGSVQASDEPETVHGFPVK